MMFELGNRMPRITWFRVPFTCGAPAAGAVVVPGAGALLEHDTASNESAATVRTRIDATSMNVKNSRESLLARRSDKQGLTRPRSMRELPAMLPAPGIKTLGESEELMKIASGEASV